MSPADCPTPDELAGFHAGRLPAADIDRITAHVEGCPACEAKLQALDGHTGSAAEFVRQPLTEAWGPAVKVRPAAGPAAGSVIAGRYKLTEPLGEGGMGAVWMAQQTEPVRRAVAVKLIKPGMDSAAVLARFEAERQALALMDHPNIAKILDAGQTDHGRPFFVMELVKGVPITSYCDQHRLTPRERMGLFVAVCRAVQHAHQKGVIHRDIKPNNVLVARYDGVPVPKVIDFGVAKATGQPLTDRTLMTGFGAVVGTPEYMAPEQAELNQLDIDTRADVYALGVLLYELLTGSTPLTRQRLRTVALLEILRLVREEEPPPPSSRLSTADALAGIAAARGMEPKRLTALMKGELDWVVMKALDKDRGRRYDTANGLARDLERYMADEPVEAGRPTAAFRLRKLARRHRRAATAVVAGVLLLTLAAVGGTTLAVRAARAEAVAEAERLRAVQQRDTAQAVNDLLVRDILGQADPDVREEHAPDLPLRAVLDRAAARAPARLADRPLVEATVRLTLAGAYSGLDAFAEAEGHAARAVALRRRELGDDHPDTLAAEHTLALVHQETNDHLRAIDLFDRVHARRAAVLGEDHPDTLDTLNRKAGSLQMDGRAVDAIAIHERVLAAGRRALGEGHADAIRVLYDLGSGQRLAGRFAESVATRERALGLAVACPDLGPDHPYTLNIRNGLALTLLSQTGPDAAARRDRAEGELRTMIDTATRTLGPNHSITLLGRNSLGLVHAGRQDWGRAEAEYRAVLAGRTATLGADHYSTLNTKARLATVAANRTDRPEAARLAEAERLQTEVLAVARRKPGVGFPGVQIWLGNLANTHARRGNHAAAEAEYAELLAHRKPADNPDEARRTGGFQLGLGTARLRLGRPAEAEAPLRQAVAALPPTAADLWSSVEARLALGECLLALGRADEGVPLLTAGFTEAKDRQAARLRSALRRMGEAADLLARHAAATGDAAAAARWRAERAKYPREPAPPPRPGG